jgi:topoisomerase-4 subunit A
VSSLADTQGTPIVGLLSAPADSAVLFGTAGGNALRAKIENLVTRQRAGKQFVAVDEGDALIEPTLIPADAKEAAALSGEGRLLIFPLEEVKELSGGGKGIIAIKLHEGEKMLGLRALGEGVKVVAYGRGDKRTTLSVGPKDLEHYRGARARTGRVLQGSFKRIEGFE